MLDSDKYAPQTGMQGPEVLVFQVRRLIEERLATLPLPLDRHILTAQLAPGKMLRTRLAEWLAEYGLVTIDFRSLVYACAATEMAHTASLCHDDVIDGGLVRRHRPALWQVTSASAAVLIGDVLLGEAIELLLGIKEGCYVGRFVSRVREVCIAEAEHELKLRGKRLDERTCMRLARGKTGPLFAFVGYVCGSDDRQLSLALEEAGYLIGTAYQLADDLLDVVGDERVAGKTLGTDLRRRKFTLVATARHGQKGARERITELCGLALEHLDSWPCAQTAVEEFFVSDLQPVLDRCSLDLAVGSELVP